MQRKLDEIRQQARPAAIWQGQIQNVGIAFLMMLGAFALLKAEPGDARLVGLTSAQWARVSIMLAVLHQIIVAIVFRAQLYRGLMSRLFGDKDLRVWAAIFMPFLAARPLTVLASAIADDHPITGARWLEVMIGLALIAVAVWAMHSVLKYFTIPRALGGDHFRDAYAAMPMVREGAFAVTPNAMYGLVFLGLWGIALTFGSWNALVVAFFQHCFIWVHMMFIEKPDMDQIYG